MLVVSQDYLAYWKVPVNKHYFGENKTWRGFIVMPIASAMGGLCLYAVDLDAISYSYSLNSITVASLAGIAYVVFELPNSFIKRRMNIPAGELPKQCKPLFIAMDQLDSAIGITAMFWLVLDIKGIYCLTFLFSGPCLAITIKKCLYLLGLKETAA